MSNSMITLVRGDSLSFDVTMKDQTGAQINFSTGDTLYFTVKADFTTATKTFQKTITSFTDGKARVEILPADTSALAYGQYVYDMQWNKADGTKTTIVGPDIFRISPEVTYE